MGAAGNAGQGRDKDAFWRKTLPSQVLRDKGTLQVIGNVGRACHIVGNEMLC